jgi:transcriptional regulator with XRE-family HTH domain
MNVGQTIKDLRVLFGFSQTSFANALGISQSHLSLVEKGKRTLHQDGLEKVGTILGMPIGLLYFLSMSPEDVPENRREVFIRTKPKVDELLKEIFPLGNLLSEKVRQ